MKRAQREMESGASVVESNFRTPRMYFIDIDSKRLRHWTSSTFVDGY